MEVWTGKRLRNSSNNNNSNSNSNYMVIISVIILGSVLMMLFVKKVLAGV